MVAFTEVDCGGGPGQSRVGFLVYFNVLILFMIVRILAVTFAKHVRAPFASLFLTLSQHFSLQWRILVMLISQTKVPEFQAYVSIFAMICLR